MNAEQQQAYDWAKSQNYQSVAAQYARALAAAVDDMQAQPSNDPLTLEQLREMKTPYPLWLENLPSGDMVKSYFQPVLFTGIRLRADREERACWITSEASRANISVSRISSHGGVKFYDREPEAREK